MKAINKNQMAASIFNKFLQKNNLIDLFTQTLTTPTFEKLITLECDDLDNSSDVITKKVKILYSFFLNHGSSCKVFNETIIKIY